MNIYYHETVYGDKVTVYGCKEIDAFLSESCDRDPVPADSEKRNGGEGHKFNGDIMFWHKWERISQKDKASIGLSITVYDCDENFREKMMGIIKKAVKNKGFEPLQDGFDRNPATTWAEWEESSAPSDEEIQKELIPEILRLLQEARDNGDI
ncbi:MAG: hypothetical protein J6O18_02285 [Bacilli bacterium]|nr:hypothetical protein [Bacilli bacterium]